MSVDEKRGLVFLPLTSPAYDFYGGDRKGANLYGNSVVALECRTGRRRWHYQTVHHDVWDYDLPAAPVLVEVKRDGKTIPAVAQVTKTGFVFVLHRETGEPLFPVEERPVPKSAIPGEETHPTQPYPTKPPPLARQSMTAAELTEVTPESRAECLAITEGAKLDVKLYDPLGEQDQALFPGLNGGANYGGASFDPGRGLLFVNTMDVGGLFRLVKRREGAALPYALRAKKYEFFTDAKGYPCQRPPWGSLYAVDLGSGEVRWRATLGEFDELKARGIAKTGAPNIGGIHRHGRRPRLHRGHQRPEVPRLRPRHGRGAVDGEPARERLRHPRHLPGAEVGPAVRGDRGRRREQVRQGVQRARSWPSPCPRARRRK